MTREHLSKAIGTLLLFCLLWWALTNGSLYQLWFGAVVIAIATFASLKGAKSAKSSPKLRLGALAKFVPYFIYQSLSGGLSVALLAILPKDRIHSVYHEFETVLPREAESARMFFASCLCIFPGTLSCGYEGDLLIVHALDEKLLDPNAIRELEAVTAAIFAADLGSGTPRA